MTQQPWQISKLRRWLRRVVVASLLIFLAVIVFVRSVAGTPVDNVPTEHVPATKTPFANEQLIVLSVNCAHGRADSFHQLLKTTQTLKDNCRDIGKLLKSQNADVVALQECDAPSWWSGNFHHARAIAEASNLSHFVHGCHVDGAGLHYGTALVSQLELRNGKAITFASTPPTFSKGFTTATLTWPSDPEFQFDVVSVHLDFASAAARKRQTQTMIEVLQEHDRPVIVAGDFNSDWSPGTAVRQLVDALDLSTFEPQQDHITFPTTGGRLDWILVSPEFQIVEQQVIKEAVSDHWPVRTIIRRQPAPANHRN